MLLIELKELPLYVHKQILRLYYIKNKKTGQYIYRDVLKEISRNGRTAITRVFIEGSPKGWWLALRIMMKGPSRLYRLVEVKELDLPSVLLKASLEEEWNLNLEREVEKALREGGWIE